MRPGHDDVGEQQIEFAAAVDDGERLGGIGGGQRACSRAPKLRDHVFAHQRIVLDHEDGLVAALDLPPAPSRLAIAPAPQSRVGR